MIMFEVFEKHLRNHVQIYDEERQMTQLEIDIVTTFKQERMNGLFLLSNFDKSNDIRFFHFSPI